MVLPGRQTRTGLIKERQKATEDGRCGPLYHLCLEDCNNRKRRVRVGGENKVRVIGKPISFFWKREWRFCRSIQREAAEDDRFRPRPAKPQDQAEGEDSPPSPVDGAAARRSRMVNCSGDEASSTRLFGLETIPFTPFQGGGTLQRSVTSLRPFRGNARVPQRFRPSW